MKITVVIPAYNAAATIRSAIGSVLQQTLKPVEIIIVDDASSDNTTTIAGSYKEVTLVRQQANAGPSATRNKGWDMAKGDIIAFLDSDDVWHPEKLHTISQIFQDYGHIQYLGHPYVTDSFPTDLSAYGKVNTQPYLSTLLKNPYQPSCIAVRTSLPERFNESYRYCEDHELSIRVAHKYATHWLNTPLTKLGRPQLSKGGASANKWKMRKGELRLYSSVYKHNPVYLIFIPVLWLWSLSKMVVKLISG